MPNRIVEILGKFGKTQADLVKATGISKGLLSKIMNDKTKSPGIVTVYKILDGLYELTGINYTVEQIFPRNNRKNNKK